jgi:hypothetical protein
MEHFIRWSGGIRVEAREKGGNRTGKRERKDNGKAGWKITIRFQVCVESHSLQLVTDSD